MLYALYIKLYLQGGQLNMSVFFGSCQYLDRCFVFVEKLVRVWIQGDHINMAVFFLTLVKSDFSSFYTCTKVYTEQVTFHKVLNTLDISDVTLFTRYQKSQSCLTGHPVVSGSSWIERENIKHRQQTWKHLFPRGGGGLAWKFYIQDEKPLKDDLSNKK